MDTLGLHDRAFRVTSSCVIALVLCTGCESKSGRDEELSVTAGDFTNSVGMEMVALESGLYVSRYETRQGEYEAVMGDNPSLFKGADLPVESVTAVECDEFCEAMTRRDRDAGMLPEGYAYRLPSFEEWRRIVCDASIEGSVSQRGLGVGLALGSTLEVGNGEQNRLGLYDTRGNVSEFVSDVNYAGRREFAGTSWVHRRAEAFEPDYRAAHGKPNERSASVGFRCVLAPAR